MLLLATFMLTVGVALCLPAPGGMMGTTAMPGDAPKDMCCPPDKWQANVIDLKSKDGLANTGVYAVDAVNQVEGFYVVPMGTTFPSFQSFTDYKTMTTYTVDMTGTDYSKYTCIQKKVTRPFAGNCHTNMTADVYTNVKYVGDSSIGPISNSVKFDVWTLTHYDLDIVMAFTKDGCIPMLENVKSNPMYTKEQFEMLFMFNDVSTTLTNPELLTLPAACIGSSVVG